MKLNNHNRSHIVKFIGMILKGLGLFSVITDKFTSKKATSCRLGQDQVSLCTGFVAGAIHNILFGRRDDTAAIISNSREKRIISARGWFSNNLFYFLLLSY